MERMREMCGHAQVFTQSSFASYAASTHLRTEIRHWGV